MRLRAAATLLACTVVLAQDHPAVIALRHVRVIDGAGNQPQSDRTIVIRDGRIASITTGAAAAIPAGVKVLELEGRTVFPGMVLLHEHMFYPAPTPDPTGLYVPFLYSFPRLYLAAGVTTLRTGGTVDAYGDLGLKHAIDSGERPGPAMFITAPYLEGSPPAILQLHPLKDANDARRMVNYWADTGATSFKAYMHITRAELGAAITAAHARGLKVTGHLCSVTFREAASLGIDNLEHGFFVASDFAPAKKADECPDMKMSDFANLDTNGSAVRDLIRFLVDRKVAITSTLPVFEASVAERPLNARAMEVLDPQAREIVEARRAKGRSIPLKALQVEESLEHAFVAAGGTLLAGTDPTGNGGTLPGFGSQREVELLVEAGFTPVQALKIATTNGARFLGIADRTGSIEEGKCADLVVVRGNPAEHIQDIENVEMVFRNGVRYDAAALIDAVKGKVGRE